MPIDPHAALDLRGAAAHIDLSHAATATEVHAQDHAGLQSIAQHYAALHA